MPLSRTVAPYSPPPTPFGTEAIVGTRQRLRAFHTGYQPAGADVRRGPPAHQDHRPVPRRDPALSLIWAVLELASRGWRGVTMTPKAVAQIERIRRGQTTSADLSTSLADQEVIAA